jgi:phosphate starvation-inducible protein PhoH
MVVTGDLKQTDKPIENGLNDFIERFKKYERMCEEEKDKTSIEIVELDKMDIQRSKIVQNVIDMYDFSNGDIN